MYEPTNEIPLPDAARATINWPFTRMEIGQSLRIDFDEHWLQGCRAARSCGVRNGWKFQTKWHKNAKNDAGELAPYGVIWRVA